MELTQRQKKILQLLTEEYIERAEPISSGLLKQRHKLNVSPATIRNELQELTELGFLKQPHTSAGRVPTHKGYRYFIQITITQEDELPQFITKEIQSAREKINRELALAQELTKSLQEISQTLSYQKMEEDLLLDILSKIGPSQSTYEENINLMKELLRKFEKFQ